MLLKQIEKRQMELRELKDEKEKIVKEEKLFIKQDYKKETNEIRNPEDRKKTSQKYLDKIKICDNKIKILDKKIDFLQLLILQLQEIYNNNIAKDIFKMLIENYEKIQKTPLRYKKVTKLFDDYKFCYLDKDCIIINNFNKDTEVYFYISDSGYFEEKYIFSLEKLQNLYNKIVAVNSLEQVKKIETMVQETLDFENKLKDNIKELKDKNDKKRKELKDNNLNYLQNHLYNNLQNKKQYL